jgi:shikimate dehydrogenase
MAEPNQFGLAGLVGWPVAHSRSPTIHNYWLDHYKIAGRYVLLPVPPEKLSLALPGLAVLGFRG